jgi:hypothetical protein
MAKTAIAPRCKLLYKVCLSQVEPLINKSYHGDRKVPFDREQELNQNLQLRMAGE